MSVDVKVKYDQGKVDRLVDAMMVKGMEALGKDIQRRAIVLEPVLTGRLRRNTKSFPSSKTVKVVANTPYAKIRHEVNNKNPQTRLYLTRALKSITSPSRYFKGILK